jgi:hypothetical protein
MRSEDWKTVRRRPDWREADLHDLRLRYAALLLDIQDHRCALEGLETTAADRLLWEKAEQEGF